MNMLRKRQPKFPGAWLHEREAWTATWTDGTYAYSISLSAPVSEEEFRVVLETNF